MTPMIGLDFETYSPVDLPKHGLDRYVNHPLFTPLRASVVHKHLGATVYRKRFQWSEPSATNELRQYLSGGHTIVAHNAGFEAAVLNRIGIHVHPTQFVDSAVVARIAGAAGKLEAAAPQLLGIDKIEEGKNLMRLFSFPGPYQEKAGHLGFDWQIIRDYPKEWDQYGHYCDVDAELGLTIAERYTPLLTSAERTYMAITMEMNQLGWPVDVGSVKEMQRRYLENQEVALQNFRSQWDAQDLNLNSLVQLKEWCAKRGVKANSFDEAHVERLTKAINRKLTDGSTLSDEQYYNYRAVAALLATKQILGGASLKKLQTIIDTVGSDERLRDQYLHAGAGQTLRTTGRSVQMQNLKRLGEDLADMSTLMDDDVEWSNTEMANNMRQIFTASDPDGLLLVGDFASVESRGLAWLAREDYKVQAYRDGKDMYKVLAATMFNVHYNDVLKPQRQTGKVGELSCGYGAGPGAVKDFAAKMGVEFTEAEAAKLVMDWREANPKVVQFWADLDRMLHEAVNFGSSVSSRLDINDGFSIVLRQIATPESLQRQHAGAKSIELVVFYENMSKVFLRRIFHGCYDTGKNIRYYKPSERKHGDLWKATFVNPKTKQTQHYELYGGKLSGILTQSFCRELFFRTLQKLDEWAKHNPDQVQLIGQFHDEVVVNWRPGTYSYDLYMSDMERIMSDSGIVVSFPLAAEIKCDYRYTK